MTNSAARPSTTSRIKQKLLSVYLRLVRFVWRHIPGGFLQLPAGRVYGMHVNRIVRLSSERRQYHATFFLRNRPELELLQRIVSRKPQGARLDLTILACSKGAEVYSMVWALRSVRPDLQLNIHAIDISQEIVDFAAEGNYSRLRPNEPGLLTNEAAGRNGHISRNTAKDQNAWLFERVSPEEMAAIFEAEGDRVSVRPWLREGITWQCGDAGNPGLVSKIGLQEIVVANRFLCHMVPTDAENCLRNIGRLVRPGGYLFVSGIDLDVRTKVAVQEAWTPVTDLIREIHDGDDSIRNAWPLEYWSLEPFDDRGRDWRVRYAPVFQIGVALTESAKPVDHQRTRGNTAV